MKKPEFKPGDWVLVRKSCGTSRSQVEKVEDHFAWLHFVCKDDEGHLVHAEDWVDFRELQPLKRD